jgi:hypothetical protein
MAMRRSNVIKNRSASPGGNGVQSVGSDTKREGSGKRNRVETPKSSTGKALKGWTCNICDSVNEGVDEKCGGCGAQKQDTPNHRLDSGPLMNSVAFSGEDDDAMPMFQPTTNSMPPPGRVNPKRNKPSSGAPQLSVSLSGDAHCDSASPLALLEMIDKRIHDALLGCTQEQHQIIFKFVGWLSKVSTCCLFV